MFKWKHPQKTKTSNQRHLPVLFFEIELILSQKQERATKSSKKATDGKLKHAPKTKTSNNEPQKQQRAFFIPIFIHLLQLWTYGRWLTSRAMKNQKEQRRATKSNEKQQIATKSNKKQKRTSKLEKPKQGIKGTKNPNGNQAIESTYKWPKVY